MLLLLVGCLLMGGCGSEVVEGGSGSGGGGGSGSGDGSGGGGSGGSGGGSGGSGGGVCVPGPDEPSPVQPSCADLAGLELREVIVKDGNLKAGESTVISANLVETTGKGFYGYPGVVFTSPNPGVEVGEPFWLYGISACDTVPVQGYVNIASDVAPGTLVTVIAQVGILHEDCPHAYKVPMPIEVQ